MNGSTQTAAVITPGRVFYGNGTVGELPGGVHRDLGAILDGAARRFAGEACIVVDGVRLAQLADTVPADGWRYSELRAWTTFRRDGQLVSLGVRDDMQRRYQHFTLFGADTDPGTVAMLLDRYQAVAGCAWRGSPAMSSLSLMISTWGNPRNQPLWHHVEKGAGHAGPLVWNRELNEWEASWGWVHTFDANAAYLGSAINAEVAWSGLHNTGPRDFDAKRPGYWLIDPGELPELLAEREAPPLFSMRARSGRVCVTTPYARLLVELGMPFTVLDSWTADRATRVTRRWGELLRDARATVESWPAGGLRDAVLAAVKRTYTDAVGAMQRVRDDGGGMIVQRPDWAHTIIDLWRATLFRKMVAIRRGEGVWPVHVNTDALSYADCSDTPRTLYQAIGVRPRLGGWKHAGSAETPDWVAAHPVREPRRLARVGGS